MTTMSIKTFLEVSSHLPVETSVLLRGPHGIGKSQVVRQVAAHFGLPVTDRRLSQMSEGDMIGLPSTDGEVTRFNPPDWYKEACRTARCLFLDELNRATPEVMQAAFQVVLDRELNGWKLHPETRVYAAINASAAYTVNEMDPALLDRFWVVDLTPTAEDLIAWGRGKNPKKSHGHNLAPIVADFLTSNEKWADPPREVEPGKVNSSRRSWERLGDALAAAGILEDANNPLFYPMCLGYVGTEATIAFHSYAKTADNQVTGKDVIDSYDRVQKKLKKLGQEKLVAVVDRVAEHVTGKLKKLDDNQGKNLAAFMKDLPGELRVSAWGKLTQGSGTDNLELAKAVHKYCVES
ncbi:MAG: AAA family ATPase, partial [Betaproteobacteria bacterium]|nr:AAA family ATPase [Betaproteobacteria bacterium]